MERAESGVHIRAIFAVEREHAVAAGKPQPGAAFENDLVRRDALFDQRGAAIRFERAEFGGEVFGQRTHEADLADRLYRREPDAIGGQDPRQRMDQHCAHAQCIGHTAGMLSARSPETGERISGDVMPARDADLADCIRHVVDRDGQEAFGNVLERTVFGQASGDVFQPRARRGWIERLVAIGAEDAREKRWIDPAEKEVAVGHRQRAVLAIASRARIGACAFRADAEAPTIIPADRAAACGHRVDLHHRCGDPHSGYYAVGSKLVFARVVGDIGAGPAHVEPDELAMAQRLARRDHPDHTAGRAREDSVLPAEGAHFGQPAVRLHEAQAVGLRQACLQGIGIAPQNRREIGIDHRGVAARNQADQRGDLVADADLGEAFLARDLGEAFLMCSVVPAVHQDDGQRIEPVGLQRSEMSACRCFIERGQNRAVGTDPLVDLDDTCGQLFGQQDMPCEYLGARLVADPQRIAEASRNREGQPLALAFEQRIGGYGRTDPQFGDRAHPVTVHQSPHGFARGIVVMAGVLRQQLVGHQPSCGSHGDDIGKGPAAIDCEAPCARICLGIHASGLCTHRQGISNAATRDAAGTIGSRICVIPRTGN